MLWFLLVGCVYRTTITRSFFMFKSQHVWSIYPKYFFYLGQCIFKYIFILLTFQLYTVRWVNLGKDQSTAEIDQNGENRTLVKSWQGTLLGNKLISLFIIFLFLKTILQIQFLAWCGKGAHWSHEANKKGYL